MSTEPSQSDNSLQILERNAAKVTGCLFLAFVILFLTSCSTKVSPWVHFKIIVDVEADGETYSGSSVLGMRYASRKRLGSKGLVSQAEMKGEAPFVDIGEHGTLFALLSVNKDNGFTYFGDIFRIPVSRLLSGHSTGIVADMEQLAKMVGQGTELSCLQTETEINDCPVMARFGDIEEPASVEQVDPRNLSESFGPGVRLKSVRFEITDEPISEKIYEKLPWLAAKPELVDGIPKPIFGGAPRGMPNDQWDFASLMNDGYFKVAYVQ